MILPTLFDFQGDLPAPFHTLDSPRFTEPEHLSMYNSYGERNVATLSPPFITAIHTSFDLADNHANGAIGESLPYTFAEYQRSPSEIHLAKYNQTTGILSYGIYKNDVLYPSVDKAFDPLVLWLALLPALYADAEFQKQFDAYKKRYAQNAPVNDRVVPMSVLCDNAYRRLSHPACPAHLPVNLFPSLNRFSSSVANINITNVHAGKFQVFGQQNANAAKSKKWSLSALQEKYAMDQTRILTSKEQSLIPEIPSYFDIPDQAVFVCKHIIGTSHTPVPIRNIM